MASNILHEAIRQTLRYSDIFSFPLKKEEIWQNLLLGEPVKKAVFDETFASMVPTFLTRDTYYALSQKTVKTASVRRQLTRESQRKIAIAKNAAFHLRNIPAILFVGISGAVAANNAHKNDDIDLFLVTKRNRLWLTRLLVLLVLEKHGIRRRRGEEHVSDRICLNMLVDEEGIAFPPTRQEIYTAHELSFLIPLWERNKTYQLLCEKNAWVKGYMYNAYAHMQKNSPEQITDSLGIKLFAFFVFSHGMFELIAKIIQLLYMRSHRSSEIVAKHILAFHPHDYRRDVLKNYAV